jgi:FkbM family methyltransferase
MTATTIRRFTLDQPGTATETPRADPALRARLRHAHRVADVFVSAWPLRAGPRIVRGLLSQLLPPLRAPLVCPTSLGFDLVVAPADGKNYYYLGCYERGTLHVMRHCLRPGDVFVDAGASVGQMTLLASDLVGPEGRVLAFEPHPARFAGLAEGIRVNARRNVVAWEAALGEADGAELKLYTARVSPSLVQSAAVEERHARVHSLRLDSTLSAEGVARVRMLKVDVEGFEATVLRGAGDLLRREQAPIVCLEHSTHGVDPMEPLRWLASVNEYRFFNLSRTKDCVSRLREVVDLARVRGNDNVFALLPSHVVELACSALFA